MRVRQSETSTQSETADEIENERENQRISMRDLEALSSIDPITTTSTSTGDSECVSKYIFFASGV